MTNKLELIKEDELKHVTLDRIIINPYQPRRTFHPEELEELAQSIKTVGLIHPPLVRPVVDSDCYELISGERRFRAAQLAQLHTMPIYIRHTDYAISAQAALIENVQRVDLNPIEIAKALKQLMSEFNLNQDHLAARIGKKRSTVANYLRLLTLPTPIQESVLKECITMGHAKAILALEEKEKQYLLHELILRDDLTVRQAEQAALRIGEKVKKQQLKYVPRDFHIEHLAQQLQERLGTKVHIQAQGKKGRIFIDYYNLNDLDRVLQLLGIKEQI
jgi:ParB family transcriptional regulator, chromosome partitioning protein